MPVRRNALDAGLGQRNSPEVTPAVSTRSRSRTDCSSSSWLIVFISGFRNASPHASIQSIHSTSSLPSGT